MIPEGTPLLAPLLCGAGYKSVVPLFHAESRRERLHRAEVALALADALVAEEDVDLAAERITVIVIIETGIICIISIISIMYNHSRGSQTVFVAAYVSATPSQMVHCTILHLTSHCNN